MNQGKWMIIGVTCALLASPCFFLTSETIRCNVENRKLGQLFPRLERFYCDNSDDTLCEGWHLTQTAIVNVCGLGCDVNALEAFSHELERKSHQPLTAETLHWIWNEMAKIAAPDQGRVRYLKKYRPLFEEILRDRPADR